MTQTNVVRRTSRLFQCPACNQVVEGQATYTADLDPVEPPSPPDAATDYPIAPKTLSVNLKLHGLSVNHSCHPGMKR